MKQVVVALLVTMLCACGTVKLSENKITEENEYDKLVGRSVDELIIANGSPAYVYQLDRGYRVFEYSLLKEAMTGGQHSLRSAAAQSARVQSPGGYAAAQSDIITSGSLSGGVATLRKRKEALSQECRALFRISALDIIESWSIEGQNCN